VDKIKRNEELLERLIRFSQKIVSICRKLPYNPVNLRIIPQVTASSGSMAANYAESCGAESAADFIHKIRLVKKEAKETRVHLRILYTANPYFKNEILGLGKESAEYIKIFYTIDKRCQESKARLKKS
jgi:four helix bundle protein